MPRRSTGTAQSTNGWWSAYAACAWMVFFAIVHVYWALGGTLGMPPGRSVFDTSLLLFANLVAIPLSVVGALLALALVRPWGRRFEVRKLLAVSWAAAAFMVLHAVTAIGVLFEVGAEGLTTDQRYILLLYEPYWLVGGILLALAAWHFQRNKKDLV